MPRLKLFCILLFTAITAGCSKGPGPLEGTWQMNGLQPLTITYRDGEEESMGMINKVTYEYEGNDVLVTYTDGLLKGTTIRVTITSQNTAITAMGKLIRVK